MNHREHILVVDDENSIRLVICDALESQGYQVVTAADPAEALLACERQDFDLALVDIKMPGNMDGLDLLSAITRRWSQTVVIMMSGYGTLDSVINALRKGALDYITKPASMSQIVESVERGLAKRREEFRHQQLIAQIEDTLRELKRERATAALAGNAEAERFIQTSELTIDRQKRLVVRGDEGIELTATEFDLLDYLARHADRIVTASELVKATQGYDLSDIDARPMVRVHIRRLRQKLEPDPDNPQIIVNVRGKGYRFAG
ncbi:MAG: response regulator transcription factor [Chloroflexi bacterium]|nr:response regulator transcription factor [Chloroflexota bacterium]